MYTYCLYTPMLPMPCILTCQSNHNNSKLGVQPIRFMSISLRLFTVLATLLCTESIYSQNLSNICFVSGKFISTHSGLRIILMSQSDKTLFQSSTASRISNPHWRSKWIGRPKHHPSKELQTQKCKNMRSNFHSPCIQA